MAKKKTIELIRITYFSPEQIEKLKENASIADLDKAFKYIQSDKFLDPFAAQVEENFSQDEINVLFNVYSLEVVKKYARNCDVFLDIFVECQKVLNPPLVYAEENVEAPS